MVYMSLHRSSIDNELSALLRIVRSHYHGDIKLHIAAPRDSAPLITEFQLKVLQRTLGYYHYLFIVKIPRLYPVEPLWAEPVILCKQMREEFKADDFRSYKLKPLIDNLVVFCHKFQSMNVHNLVITFPSSGFNGDEHVASKVFELINKALSKMNPPILSSLPQQINKIPTGGEKLKQSIGFYNDMGINIINYINMYDKFRNKSMTFNYLKSRPNRFNLRKSQLLSKKVLPKRPQKPITKLKAQNISELNFCNMRNLIASLLMIPDKINKLDFQDDLTIEMGENFRIHLKMIYDTLIIRKTSLMDFISYVNSSYTHCETKPNNLRYNCSLNLLPFHSREIISLEINSRNVQYLVSNFNLYQQSKSEPIICTIGKEIHTSLQKDCEDNIHAPVYSTVSVQMESLIFEACDNMEIENIIIIPKPNISLTLKSKHIIKRAHYKVINRNGSVITEKSIQNSPPSKGDLPNDVTECLTFYPKNILINKYIEILTEVIQFPKNLNDPFEYFLDLNPQDNRHRIIFDSIGLVRHINFSNPEILASSDHNLNFFFVKESINVNNTEFIIRLHKLSTENVIYNLLNEENHYYKSLEQINKNVWYMAKTSEFIIDLFGSAFKITNMYFSKIKRQKLITEEAKKLNYTNLPIRRCHFYNEFIESLALFCKSH